MFPLDKANCLDFFTCISGVYFGAKSELPIKQINEIKTWANKNKIPSIKCIWIEGSIPYLQVSYNADIIIESIELWL